MSIKFSQGLVILLLAAASMVGVSMANKDWQYGFNYTDWLEKYYHRHNQTGPRKIIVGGDQKWSYGVDYFDWTAKNGPFYLNDTLVFKFDPPKGIFQHSVYLFKNYWSFMNCDLKRARIVANVTDGKDEGFEFVLKRWQPYYFACGEHDGLHCKDGKMKFIVMPTIRPWW